MKTPSLKALVGLGLVVLLINSGYIAAFADPTIFYMGNVLAHFVIGVLLAVLFGVLLVRDAELRRRLMFPAIILAAALGLGLFLAWAGAIHDHDWARYAHIAVAAIGVAALLPYGIRACAVGWRAACVRYRVCRRRGVRAGLPARRRRLLQDSPDAKRSHRQSADGAADDGRAKAADRSRRSSPRRRRRTSAASSRRTSSWTRRRAASATRRSTQQWKSSVHHFASFNNQFYRKSIEYMQVGRRHAAEQVVRRLPRSRRLLQRTVRSADQGSDRHARSARRPGVHVVPLHHARRQHRWATAASRSSIRRCTSWRPARTSTSARSIAS